MGGPMPKKNEGAHARAFSVLGFGMIQAWTYVVFFSRLVHYSTRNSIEHLNSTYSFACCGIIAALLLYAIPWKAIAKDGPLGKMRLPLVRGAQIAAASAVALCTLILTFVEHDFFRQPWCSIAATVAGVGLAVLFLGWARVFVHRSGSHAFVDVALSFICGAALFFVITSLPVPLALGITYLLPLGSCLALNVIDLEMPDRSECPSLPQGTLPAFVRMMVSFFLLGLAESLVRALFLEVDPGTQSFAYQTLFLISTTCAAILVTCAGRYRKNPARALNRVSLFTLVFLSILAPIVKGLGIWGDLPALTCYSLFYLFIWATLAQTARVFNMPVRFAFGWGLGIAYAGCLAGTFFGSLITSFASLDYRQESLLALVCASLVLVALVFVTDDRMLTRLMDTDSDRPQAPRRFMLRIDEAARAHGLTAKETEVLRLAAKGRTTQRICEELGISTGTANTHLMHIYKKFDVHDRQQLLDVLENHGDA